MALFLFTFGGSQSLCTFTGEIATFLSSFPRLEEFWFGLEFQLDFAHPDRPSQIPFIRSVLPTLTLLKLRELGAS